MECISHLFLYIFQVEVGHVREIDEIFDAISYKKGAAIIRMLQTYLGADKFQVIFGRSSAPGVSFGWACFCSYFLIFMLFVSDRHSF